MKQFGLIAIAMILFVACGKKDGKPTSESVGKVLQQKTWRMTIYFDDGNDKLINYTGFAFTFKPDNSIVAVRDGKTFNGYWKDSVLVLPDSSKVVSFYMKFGDVKPFRDLSKNWEVVRKTTELIHLRAKDIPRGPYDEIYFRINK